ncbi:cis-Golgi t-SNARE syntaxin [Dissophora ornata]|nr:cis-Golgi t-SNARE syntaxin [Dissophora ornata]
MIKQDLGRLNGQILALQQHVRATAAKANRATRQMDEHSTNLVIVLQSRLANISMGFKEALETRTEYVQQRSTAIEAVESTLQELGGIFQQLAQMVAEQRDTVQRIEANTDDIELNINEAQNQLLRYYSNISSDRWLMIKIFLTIIFVFLVISLIS